VGPVALGAPLAREGFARELDARAFSQPARQAVVRDNE